MILRSFQSADSGLEVTVTATLEGARTFLAKSTPDMAIIDYFLPDGKGTDLLQGSIDSSSYPLVFLTSQEDEEIAVETMKSGAFDYIKKSPETLNNFAELSKGIWRDWNNILMRRQAEEALHDSEEKYRAIFEQSQDGIILVDPAENRMVAFNDSARKNLGYTHGEFSNLGVSVLEAPEQENHIDRHAGVLLPKESGLFEKRHRTKDGKLIDVRIKTRQILIKGKPFFLSVLRNITEEKKSEIFRRLAISVFENASEAIMVTDTEGHILTTNAAFSSITGYSGEEVAGKNPKILQSGKHDEIFYKKMWTTILKEGRWSGEIWNRKKNGQIYPEWLSISSVRDVQGKVCQYTALFSDISKRKEDEEELHFRANFDALTALPNRLFMFERITHTIKLAKDHDKKVALIVVDLKRFKQVNDIVGHSGGDAVLREAADRLRHVIREVDTVGRSGGNEFLIVQADLVDRKEPALMGKKVIQVLSAPFHVNNHRIVLGACIGITVTPDDGEDTATLIKNADMALHAIKHKKDNHYRFFNPKIEEEAKTRALLQWDLTRALNNQEFVLHYQPIVALPSCDTVSLEALIRWNHPKKGLLPPGQFIEQAEDSDMIIHIGEWIVNAACRQVKEWQDRYGYTGSINVNVSPRQMSSFKPILIKALEKSGLPPECLILEITESLMLRKEESPLEKLEEIRALGVRLSMDDFGTGYSSLSYLMKYPLDILKIDRSFITNIASDNKNQPLVETILQMGQSLGMSVVAEGVETLDVLGYLNEIGCDKAQGYYFCKPLPPDAYEKVLIDQKNSG